MKIEIDEKRISALLEEMIAQDAFRSMDGERDYRKGREKAVAKAVTELISERAEEIVNRAVDLAATKLIKKGLPILLERTSLTDSI